MKVLIACEFSGTVRDAFTKRGHDAVSCDLLPTEKPGEHYQGSVLDILDEGWDMMIAHPPCTYFTNSGVCWLHREEGRWEKLDEAAVFFNALLDSGIPKVCIENPIPHKYAVERIGGRKYSQLIQPYMFGHKETKATCLWLKGLDPLKPTSDLKTETMSLPPEKRGRLHWLPPSKNRWKLRSKTYQGIADAMAEQWGGSN
tara:strand:- start:646 stop:1245 length:600 start_codon:yes stop_codon:yes gene_type:complete